MTHIHDYLAAEIDALQRLSLLLDEEYRLLQQQFPGDDLQALAEEKMSLLNRLNDNNQQWRERQRHSGDHSKEALFDRFAKAHKTGSSPRGMTWSQYRQLIEENEKKNRRNGIMINITLRNMHYINDIYKGQAGMVRQYDHKGSPVAAPVSRHLSKA